MDFLCPYIVLEHWALAEAAHNHLGSVTQLKICTRRISEGSFIFFYASVYPFGMWPSPCLWSCPIWCSLIIPRFQIIQPRNYVYLWFGCSLYVSPVVTGILQNDLCRLLLMAMRVGSRIGNRMDRWPDWISGRKRRGSGFNPTPLHHQDSLVTKDTAASENSSLVSCRLREQWTVR